MLFGGEYFGIFPLFLGILLRFSFYFVENKGVFLLFLQNTLGLYFILGNALGFSLYFGEYFGIFPYFCRIPWDFSDMLGNTLG